MDPVELSNWTFAQIPTTSSRFETLGKSQNKGHGQKRINDDVDYPGNEQATFPPFFKGDGQGSHYLTFLRALMQEQQVQRRQTQDQLFEELSFRDQQPCHQPTKEIGMGRNIPISFGAGSLYETSFPIENAESDDSELIAIIETITVTKITFPGNQQVMIFNKKREIVTN